MSSAERASNRPAGRMNGGRALAEMLRLAEVGPMFGMGGFQLLPFYDALAQLGLRHFLINDERCGAFAADAYARVTNRPGVCDGTLGPGATNLVTGLIESLNAGTPMIAIAGFWRGSKLSAQTAPEGTSVVHHQRSHSPLAISPVATAAECWSAGRNENRF